MTKRAISTRTVSDQLRRALAELEQTALLALRCPDVSVNVPKHLTMVHRELSRLDTKIRKEQA